MSIHTALCMREHAIYSVHDSHREMVIVLELQKLTLQVSTMVLCIHAHAMITWGDLYDYIQHGSTMHAAIYGLRFSNPYVHVHYSCAAS